MAKAVKKLTRSNSDSYFSGFCGGVAAYYGWDVSVVRLALVLVTIFSGFFPGILFYLIASIIVPKEGEA
jgi:phage shock protein C